MVPAVGAGWRWSRLGVALTAGALQRPAYNLSLYPVQEVSWLQSHHLVPGRVATTDYVGNYLEFRYGTRAERLHRRPGRRLPACGREGLRHLAQRVRGWQAVLARYRFDVVLWPRSEALASLIAEDPGWTVRISDRHWIVAVRRPALNARLRPSHGRPVEQTILVPATIAENCAPSGSEWKSR